MRGHVHVRQLLCAQPDHGPAGHGAGRVGAGRAVHAAGRPRRITTAATPARSAAVPAVPDDEPAQRCGRRGRGYVARGQEVPLPVGVRVVVGCAAARARGARQPDTVHQFHIE